MKKMDRKSFLKKAGVIGITTVSGSALLTACGGSEGTSETQTESTPAPEVEESAPVVEATEADCSEYNKDLTEADMQTRQALNYKEETPNAEQVCTNCRFWLPDKFEGACGGCQLIPNGAVNPQGWCQSWVAQQV